MKTVLSERSAVFGPYVPRMHLDLSYQIKGVEVVAGSAGLTVSV